MYTKLIKKLFPLLLFFPIVSYAQSVDAQFAEQIALQFIQDKSPSHAAFKSKSVSIRTESSPSVGNLFHLVNVAPQGFVVVAGNQRFEPILAYSTENNIDLSEGQNPGVDYLKGMAHSIERQLQIEEPEIDRVAPEWEMLRNGAHLKTPDVVVAPLTQTKWGQDTYYNTYCPVDQFGIDDKTWAGCLTVSMAQLLKYHGHPTRGNGTNQYDDYNYGTQTVNFGNTLYPWDNMPNELFDYNDDVATAIYHTALSVNTEFSPTYTAAYFSVARKALVYNWLYDRSAQFVARATNVTGTPWFTIIENELQASRPALMRADAFASGAHSWLIDGYDNDGFYHMNWGWNGAGNGWYKDITVQWEWIEGGTNAYYENMGMVYSLFPASHCLDYEATVDMYVQQKTENTAKLALFNYAGSVTNQFRMRKVGTTTWEYSEISNVLTKDFEGLTAGTEYEFQVRAMCSETVWNNYSDSFTFTTPGVACIGLEASQLSVGGIGETIATVATGQPYGPNDNQFQYRILNTANWTDSDVATSHFRSLTGLQSGTTYEFRVRHQCTPGVWSVYSDIVTFTTLGDAPDTGSCPVPVFFLATTITDTYAYLIGSDLNPSNQNQFRYQIINADAWTETEVSNNTYRLIQNLMPGTEYSFEVRESCSDGTWSAYSATKSFTTTGIAPEDDLGNCDAPQSLLTSSISDNATYIYLGFGGNMDNQFRYRTNGGTWIETSIDNTYYRYITSLSPGSDYEFQARVRCDNGAWSAYSSSSNFTTTGSVAPPPTPTASCIVEQSALDNDDYYFYYFITGFAQLEVQWRYGSSGSWSTGYNTVHHYAAIRNDLGIEQTGAQVRVRLQCADGTWTGYSDPYQLP